jgi:hypothetical protein
LTPPTTELTDSSCSAESSGASPAAGVCSTRPACWPPVGATAIALASALANPHRRNRVLVCHIVASRVMSEP